jgi:hypothetical protein
MQTNRITQKLEFILYLPLLYHNVNLMLSD